MQCNDCGGSLAVRGTPDVPDITCNHCDPTGPVKKFPANLTYFRIAHIEVKVDTAWLTVDNEYDEGSGWTELQEQIEAAIKGIFVSQYKLPVLPQLTWDGWDGEPEIADA